MFRSLMSSAVKDGRGTLRPFTAGTSAVFVLVPDAAWVEEDFEDLLWLLLEIPGL